MQILMSVMMATFLAMHGPARRGVRRAHRGGAATPRRRSCRPRSRSRLPGARGWSSCAASSSDIPGAESPVLATICVRRAGRARRPRSSAAPARQDHAARPDPAAHRRHRGRGPLVDGVDVRQTRSRSCCGAASAWSRRGRICSRARWRATCATASRTRPTRSCGRRSRSRRRKDFVEAMPRRARRADRAGRHERVGRPAPAAGDRARAACDKPEIYLFDDSFSALDSRPTRGCARRCDRDAARRDRIMVAQRVIDASRDADQIIVLDGRRRSSARGTHAELTARAARPTPRSCASQTSGRGGSVSDQRAGRRPSPAPPHDAAARSGSPMGGAAPPHGGEGLQGHRRARLSGGSRRSARVLLAVLALAVASVTLGVDRPTAARARDRHRSSPRIGASRTADRLRRRCCSGARHRASRCTSARRCSACAAGRTC